MNMSDKFIIAWRSLTREGPAGPFNLGMAFLNMCLEPFSMSSCPTIVQIEPTTYCNLRCVMCANPISGRVGKHLSLADFRKIIDGISGLKKISLVGAGEPLMNPDLFEMVAYAKSIGMMIGFATNAMLLDESSARKVLASGADWLNISIDSADPGKYEAIRKGADLKTVVKNVRQFMGMKGLLSTPDVSVWFVLMKENLDDLPGVIELSKRLGVTKVNAQLEHNWSNDAIRSGMKERYATEFYARVRTVLVRARQIADKEGIRFDYVNVPDTSVRRSCKWPWKSCYITAEGFVTPCCLQGSDPRIINFGNILSSDFHAIWNSSAYQEFRKTLKSQSMPRICVDCTAYHGKMKI